MNADPTSLDRFHDPVMPPPEPWWPPTPGWSIVIGVMAVMMLVLLIQAFFKWQANRYRREALSRLNDPATTPAMISSVLKQVALTAWPREEVARLTGSALLEFLDHSGSTDAFTTGPGRSLEVAAFHPSEKLDAAALRKVARLWIRQHRGKEQP